MSARLLAAALLLVPAPAMAQSFGSEGYRFLQAIKDSKGDDVTSMVEKPGSNIVNARAGDGGEAALHITVKRGDAAYTRYLLQHDADPNIRDDHGVTPLMVAITAGQNEMVPLLLDAHANPNLANQAGETPLILAVHKRDLNLVRVLLAAGANPDQPDRLAGLSARAYAERDARSPALAHIFADQPRHATAAVAGPH